MRFGNLTPLKAAASATATASVLAGAALLVSPVKPAQPAVATQARAGISVSAMTALHHYQMASAVSQRASTPSIVITAKGDTLSSVAADICGHARDWTGLWWANKSKLGHDPNVLRAGTRLRVACYYRHVNLPKPPAPHHATTQPVPPGGGVLSAAQIGQLWLDEGGAAWSENTAECIAEHESAGNTDAVSPTQDYGLYQEHGRPDVLGDGAASTRLAISMSSNGTDWSAWATHSDCGV